MALITTGQADFLPGPLCHANEHCYTCVTWGFPLLGYYFLIKQMRFVVNKTYVKLDVYGICFRKILVTAIMSRLA